MLIIGENIQIISRVVKNAINNRDKETLQALARKLVDHGADVVDLNIGRRKKDGPEVMRWMVDIMHEAIPGVPLSLDTTNAAAIEAGLERCQQLGTEAFGIPVSAEERVNIALELLLPPIMETGLPMERLYIDPLILTVKGSQEYAPNAIETIRFLKQGLDPAPRTVVGLSNISNQVPHEGRSLINRTYLVMLMAVGLDAAIADPLDEAQNEVIRIIEERDDSTPVGRLLLALYDATAAMEELDPSIVDMNDPEQVAIWKTVQILCNKVIFADSYLRM